MGLHADRAPKQYLDQRICFSSIRMPLSRWPAFAGWYQIITVKYDEKQQTKNQRVSIHQTRFILSSLYYCSVSCSTSRMPHLAICHYAKQRPPILYSINCNKIQTIRSDVWKHFHEVTYGCISVQSWFSFPYIGYSCIFHPCIFARIAISTPAFSVAPPKAMIGICVKMAFWVVIKTHWHILQT